MRTASRGSKAWRPGSTLSALPSSRASSRAPRSSGRIGGSSSATGRKPGWSIFAAAAMSWPGIWRGAAATSCRRACCKARSIRWRNPDRTKSLWLSTSAGPPGSLPTRSFACSARRPRCARTERASRDGESRPMPVTITPEEQRLAEANQRRQPWRKWGPYVSERQWGTVREDYSAEGHAWNYFPHDHARSRAYRWGEDGIGGFCDVKQTLCMAVALWNGKDPILKERMFGLSNREGNHGEDVKEIYYYLDAVPTYSYVRMLYKYPQAAFPYDLLLQENARRDRRQPEFEILDTGIFDDDRYFDVDIEYAKAGADDILLRLTVTNRGPDEAAVHVLPQVWFRNTWSWFTDRPKPALELAGDDVVVKHETLGGYTVHFDRPDEIKFCENETNIAKLYGGEDTGRVHKDGFHEYVVAGRKEAVGSHKGTKAAGIYRRTIAAGASTTIRVRLSLGPPKPAPFDHFDRLFGQRKAEADAYYAGLQSKIQDEDLRRIQRQAFAGILWSKQFFYYDVTEWLDGDPAQPQPA